MASPTHARQTQSGADAPPPPILASIVATLGPSSEDPAQVRRLIEAGVCVFRLNFSHGDLAAHERRLGVVRGVAREMGVNVAVMGDLQGPKIRVGRIAPGPGDSADRGGRITVGRGQGVVFKKGLPEATTRRGAAGEEPVLPVTYEALIDEVEIGHKVLINDGAIRMLAVERDAGKGELRCRVMVGGVISSGKGINLPQSSLSAAAVTERDWECAKWATDRGLDYLALSFVRSARDVLELKAGIDRAHAAGGAWVPVIAKIEMPQAVADLEAIVDAADGVMVARGDLGVEMDIAEVPVVQKRIVRTCGQYGKPVIVATQMLESMIENASPTRAEATDVANAVFDGADAVMLSGETAVGKHPVLVVETMARIVSAAEQWMRRERGEATTPYRLAAAHRGTAALARGAWGMAKDLDARVVVCWSQQGGTARYLSQNRFDIPIVAFSSDEASCRRMALYRGVTPVLAQPPASGLMSAWIAQVDEYLTGRGLASAGDPIVLLAGRPLGRAKATNGLTIHRVGDPGGFSAQVV
jgi:pyruvate kinase